MIILQLELGLPVSQLANFNFPHYAFSGWYSSFDKYFRLGSHRSSASVKNIMTGYNISWKFSCITVVDQDHYSLSLLRKCGHFYVPSTTFHMSFSLLEADTSSKIPTHMIKSDITINENKETILQLGAKMSFSCWRQDLFPVLEATLETLCLRSCLLFDMFTDKTIFLSRTPLLRTLAIMNTKGCPQ